MVFFYQHWKTTGEVAIAHTSKDVNALVQTLSEWFENCITDQVHAEMLHVAKVKTFKAFC